MRTRNNRMLAEGAIPTIFCYSERTKKREISEKRKEKKQETSNEFCHESSTGANPVTFPLYASKKIALFKPTIQKSN